LSFISKFGISSLEKQFQRKRATSLEAMMRHRIEFSPQMGYKTSMTEPLRTLQIQIPPGVIDLGLGDPPLALLPLDLIQLAAEVRFAEGDPSFLQYGAEQGDGNFRLALAQFLTSGYGSQVDPEGLFITNGISNALDQICTLFTQPGDIIFVEEPSYFLALRIFNDHNLRIVPIQTDRNGLVIESLEEQLVEFHPKFLYVIPTFQNPTGYTLTLERRERLIQLSQEHDFMIVADEVYHFLSYFKEPPKAFAGYTDVENVISLGSFSKILAPGLRLGWLQSSQEKIKRFTGCGLLDSGGGLNPFTSAIVRDILESGQLRENILKLIEVYRSRAAVMDSALREYLPMTTYNLPQGGYFFWVRLPGNLDAALLQRKAESFKVDFRAGVRFSSEAGMRDYIRLSFVYYEPDKIEDGIKRLKKCIEVN
jgi:2-aminoadipate transaminase